jgi:hypothetical protein
MYEFAGSKSAKLVVQKIREITGSSPDSSVYCLLYACVDILYNKSSNEALCLLSSIVVIPSEKNTQPTSLHQHQDGGQQ